MTSMGYGVIGNSTGFGPVVQRSSRCAPANSYKYNNTKPSNYYGRSYAFVAYANLSPQLYD